jgi:ribosomal protein S18 acetylase RimI-like enzyme
MMSLTGGEDTELWMMEILTSSEVRLGQNTAYITVLGGAGNEQADSGQYPRSLFWLACRLRIPHNNGMENVKLRKARASDGEFAYQVRKLAFGKYVDQVWGWDETEQQRLHQKRFASQEFRVVQWSDIDVGILALVREHGVIKINQLLVLPDYQGKGIGGACLSRIIDKAAACESAVRVQVLKVNSRAMVFFERLGFRKIGETEIHVQMEKST